eukprot:3681032-Amphidinium_carterae.2
MKDLHYVLGGKANRFSEARSELLGMLVESKQGVETGDLTGEQIDVLRTLEVEEVAQCNRDSEGKEVWALTPSGMLD